MTREAILKESNEHYDIVLCESLWGNLHVPSVHPMISITKGGGRVVQQNILPALGHSLRNKVATEVAEFSFTCI